MSTVLQIMLGMGIGLAAAIMLAYEYLNAGNQQHENRRSARKSQQFYAEPGKRCPICLDTMTKAIDMQYLKCGHALHDECFRQAMRHLKNCPECRADI